MFRILFSRSSLPSQLKTKVRIIIFLPSTLFVTSLSFINKDDRNRWVKVIKDKGIDLFHPEISYTYVLTHTYTYKNTYKLTTTVRHWTERYNDNDKLHVQRSEEGIT